MKYYLLEVKKSFIFSEKDTERENYGFSNYILWIAISNLLNGFSSNAYSQSTWNRNYYRFL